jgi:microcin C transport system substrate-binding protein
VNRAAMWVQELNFDQIQRGLIVMRRVWNHSPQGMVGTAMNTRRPPFDDIRVRKAIRLLFNREQFIAKLMFNAYTNMDSIFPGTMWENPNNEKIHYDPQKALELLGEAGYKSRDSQGRLVKDGKPLNLELLYPTKDRDQYLTIFQEDLRKVGITLNLRLVTFETMVKLLDERRFDMVWIGYTGSLFPDPETHLLSSLAEQKNSNNITGFKSKRVDELIAAYDTAYDIPTRAKIIQEVDKTFTDAHHWLFEWTAPYSRVIYWNRYGMPKGTFTRIGDYGDISSLWWIDADKEKALEEARKDSSKKLDPGPVDDKYWMEFKRSEEADQTKM